MRSVNRFALSRENGGNRGTGLVCDGRPASAVVEGSLLEAQFELDDGSALVWLTDDSPYDEGLHVYLIDRRGSVCDAIEAGADFTAGILNITGFEDNWVEFEFFRNEKGYRLTVNPLPALRLSLPAGWKYKRLFSRHRLVVSEISG